MDKLTTLAVIGCGRIANMAHFPAFAKMEGLRVKYACDLIREKAEKIKTPLCPESRQRGVFIVVHSCIGGDTVCMQTGMPPAQPCREAVDQIPDHKSIREGNEPVKQGMLLN